MAIEYPPSQCDSADGIRRYGVYVFSGITNVIVEWQKVEGMASMRQWNFGAQGGSSGAGSSSQIVSAFH